MNKTTILRVMWEFTLGIPIDYNDENTKENNNFKDAVFEITEEISKITDGLTYNYCFGTWKKNPTENTIERDLSVRISIIVLQDNEDVVYNFAKHIISKVNAKYALGINHVQAMKTYGHSKHFIV